MSIDITIKKILKLKLITFRDKLVEIASTCKDKKDIQEFETYLQDTSWHERKQCGNREDYQRVLDATLLQIDRLLGQSMSGNYGIEEKTVIEVKVENNVITAYKEIVDEDN